MYVVVRTMKVKKGFDEVIINNFNKPTIVENSPGFVKRELMYDKKNQDFDIYKTFIYFKDRKAFYIWQGSPEHIASHKNKKEKPEYLIELTKETYDLITKK